MSQRTKMDNQFAEWHTVRPWLPSLSLSVREITSVSVTFILASPYSVPEPDLASGAGTDSALAALGLVAADEEDDESRDEASTSAGTSASTSTNAPVDAQGQVVSDILAKGLSVKVNGTPWQRVIVKMDDVLDEAIIILYGLMPSRQYDVELGILPGETSVRGQITTDIETHTDAVHPDTLPEEPAVGTPESSSAPLPSSPSHANGGAHSPDINAPNFTLEDRRVQLTHALGLLTAEHTQLTTALKAARRESQKADAALRAEMDTLRRASERQAAGEGRARKKVLALQEAVKQTLAAARELEALVADIEAAQPALEARRVAVEKEWAHVSSEAARMKTRREETETREKARAEAQQAELAGLGNRLERLGVKREKLEGEGGVLAELEERLRRLEEERGRIEKDPYGYEGDAADAEHGKDDGSDSDRVHGLPHHAQRGQHHLNFHPPAHSRKRHSHPHMQHHGHHPHQHQHQPQHQHPRPSFPPTRAHQDPIHRPAGGRASFPPLTRQTQTQSQSQPQVPGVIHLQQSHPPLPHQHLHPHLGKAHRAAFRPGQGSSSSSSASSTPLGPPAAMAGSMLSGRAPPFEPGGSGRTRAGSHSAQQAPTVGGMRSELNPGSMPFAPRTSAAPASHVRTTTAS